jgi:MFS family permease
MSMGAAANALLAVNVTQSQALSAPPYNWSPGNVGFANFALVAGGVVGLAIAGPWSDWVIMRATNKNNGVREPEMRLAAMYPFMAAAVIGLTVSISASIQSPNDCYAN